MMVVFYLALNEQQLISIQGKSAIFNYFLSFSQTFPFGVLMQNKSQMRILYSKLSLMQILAELMDVKMDNF